MRALELIGVPYTSMREPGGIANAIGALRAAGLAERLRGVGVTDAGDLDLPPPTGERGPSGLLNERPLVRLLEVARAAVRGAHGRGRVPLLVGGDCPVLLAGLAALDDRPGLLMVDGHEDAWPPWRSATGEASDSELGIALGMFAPLPGELAALVPLVAPSDVALLGPRDADAIAAAGVVSLRDAVACFRAAGEIGEPAAAMAGALESISAPSLWLHVDLDVLATTELAAVDYPQTGGIGWEALGELAGSALDDPRCRGASLVIYNPDLDPGGTGGARIVEFAGGLAARVSAGGG